MCPVKQAWSGESQRIAVVNPGKHVIRVVVGEEGGIGAARDHEARKAVGNLKIYMPQTRQWRREVLPELYIQPVINLSDRLDTGTAWQEASGL